MQTVQDAPMAFCDTRTVDDSDYMPFDRVLSTHVTELMYLRHSESHRMVLALRAELGLAGHIHYLGFSKRKCW